MSLPINDKDEAYLTALKENGTLSTSEIRKATALSGDDVRNRHKKFSKAGFVELDKREVEGKHYSHETFATLTDHGRTKIVRGLFGDSTEQVKKVTEDARMNELEEQVQQLQNQVNKLQNEQNNILSRVESIKEWMVACEVSVKAVRWAVEDSDLSWDIDAYKKRIRENSD